MSISVELIPCHRGEPDWSAIDRVCGLGTAHCLDEDDPAAPVPLHDRSPQGWRQQFLAGIRTVDDWDERSGPEGISLWSDRWRWHVFVGHEAVTLTYRRTGPAGDSDLDDAAVLDLAARLGMIVYWPDLLTWADLRRERIPDTLG